MYMIASIVFQTRAEVEAAVLKLDEAGYAVFISSVLEDVYSEAVFAAAIRNIDESELAQSEYRTAEALFDAEVDMIVDPMGGDVFESGALRPGEDPFENYTLSKTGQMKKTMLSLLRKDIEQFRDMCRQLEINPDGLATVLRRDEERSFRDAARRSG